MDVSPARASGPFHLDPCYMGKENDFAGRNYPSRAEASRILASHECFHAVQNAYSAGSGVVVSEGAEVWAS